MAMANQDDSTHAHSDFDDNQQIDKEFENLGKDI